MITLTRDNRMLGFELLASFPNISHFVTTRQGGCSEGTYGTFNCSPHTGDEGRKVRENQRRLLAGMAAPVKELIVPHQVHDTRVLWVDEAYAQASLLEKWEQQEGVDAVVTALPGYCVCVSTADCVPVLLYDRQHHVVAAVHAGWRGTVARIVEKVLRGMQQRYGTLGTDVVACIGPSISLASFEVGEEVYEQFRQAGFDLNRVAAWNEQTSKHHLDLWEANRLQLEAFGVPAEQVECAGICTYQQPEQFFSARRLGIESGRILSGIVLNDK